MATREREEKIDEVIQFLSSSDIDIVNKKDIGKVNVDNSKINNEYIYENMIERGFTRKEIDEFFEFLSNANLILLNVNDVSGISFKECLFNTDEFYISRLWK